MHIPELIRRKRDGEKLSGDELRAIVKSYTDGEIPDYQMSAFLMSVFFRSMDAEELAAWTDAMLRSGDVLDLSDIPGVKVDKHSTGGVGDKVSLILAPLAVAAGLRVPMISGRGLGHTGGTLDKLESIPGFDVNKSVEEFRRLVADIGLGLIGQTGEVAPADKKLYALRDVTATVECIPLIASSIMSKKLAEGIDALVLDVKVGSGAFMKDVDSARELGETMIGIGEAMDKEVRALITDMDQPLGLAVGNTLEVAESIDILRGEGPEDATEVTVELVCEMLDAAGKVDDRAYTKKMLYELLNDGSALHVFREIIEAQGGDPRVCDDPSIMERAEFVTTFDAPKAGVIEHIHAEQVGLAALELGAGRKTKEDEIDHAVGLVFRKKRGAAVEEGEPILEIHHNERGVADCAARLEKAIRIGQGPAEDKPLIIERLG